MIDGVKKSLLGAQQGAVGAEPKPCEPAHVRARREQAQRSVLTMGVCELLMEAFSTRWEIYISNCQFARLWLAQAKLFDINRTYARVKYNSKLER